MARKSRKKVGTLVCGAVVILLFAPAVASAATTTERSITDLDGDNRLEYSAGSEYFVRTVGVGVTPRLDRGRSREQLIHFGQLTDLHVTDEESPARAEAGDGLISPSYRPQEALSAQTGAAMMEALRDIRSPIDGAAIDNYIVTGDSVDNIQLNETRGYVNVLNGGSIDPDSGDPSYAEQACPGVDVGGRPAPRYDGIKGGTDRWSGKEVGFYDPDGTPNNPLADDDGPGYSEIEAQNRLQKRRSIAVRNFPGLFEAAQLPFESRGLGRPWYGVFGNHDSLVLGTLIGPHDPNFMYNHPAFGPVVRGVGTDNWASFAEIDELAQGCRKWLPGDPLELPFLPPDKWIREPPDGDGDGEPDNWTAVPPDPARKMLDQQQWIAQHFDEESETPNVPNGHGFAEVPDDKPDATYYSFSPKVGIRYIGLDTTNRVFFANGAIRDDQFHWLEDELQKATRANELVIVYGHHTLATIDNAYDTNPSSEAPYHFGLIDERGTPAQQEHLESLEELFLRYPNVILYVAGHEHANYVASYSNDLTGGAFWETSTAAHNDWPSQARLIQVYDNCDGTISAFETLVDHAGRPDPGDSPDLSFPNGRSDPLTLASIGRELSFNDWQGSTGEDDQDDAGGRSRDRTVELVLANPVSSTAACPPPDSGQQPEVPDTEPQPQPTGAASETPTVQTQVPAPGVPKITLRLTSLSLSSKRARRVSRRRIAKAISRGFSGSVRAPGGIKKLKASLVRKRGRRCYRIDLPRRRTACSGTSARGLKWSRRSNSTRFRHIVRSQPGRKAAIEHVTDGCSPSCATAGGCARAGTC